MIKWISHFKMDLCNQSFNETGNASDVSTPVAGATIVSPTLMFLAGVFGNIFALCALYRTRTDVKTTKFYTLVTALVWTDLLGIVMTSPSTIAAYANGRVWAGGTSHCRYHGFVMTCFGLATPVIICAMAIERFLALKCVFFYTTRCKNATARGVVVTLWVGVILYSVLPLFGIGTFKRQYPDTWCYLDFHTADLENNLYGYIYASFNLMVIFVMTLCNVYVMFTLVKARLRWGNDGHRRDRLLSEGKETPGGCRHGRQKQKDVEIQMIVLLCALTTVFAVCWSPLMIQIIITMATRRKNEFLDLIAVRLASFNQTLDPWLYILLRRSFCVKAKKLFKRIFCFCALRESEAEQSTPDGPNDVRVCQPQNILSVFRGEERFTQRQKNKPDLLDAISPEISNNTQLPDVAATQQLHPNCVCHIHIENNLNSDDQDDGIYVKFLILSREKSSNRSRNRTLIEKSMNISNYAGARRTQQKSLSSNDHSVVEDQREANNGDSQSSSKKR